MRKKTFFSLLFVFGFISTLAAQQPQDKTQLEKEREEIQKEIEQIEGAYNKVKGQTKTTLGTLNILNSKIRLQERYIGTINNELRMIDDDIYRSNLEIYRLQKQLDTLKVQYSRTVVYAYKNRSSYDYLNFVFSASSFNDVLKRIAYLKSYRAYREKQVNTIQETQQLIAQRKQQQIVRKDQKNKTLDNQNRQKSVLDEQKNEKAGVLSKLKSQEKDLQKQLAGRKKRDRDLQNAISAIVRREIEAARKEAEKKAAEEAKKNAVVNPVTDPSLNPTTGTTTSRIKSPTLKPTVIFNTDADLKLNAGFESNRGRLPWPVDNGFVSVHFGRYEIENTHLTGDNPGITIATKVGTSVKTVFKGEVVAVFNMGDGMAVAIRHGKYFTTYSNLTSLNVSKGTLVETGQVLGKAGRDDDGVGGQIDFILMIEKNNVNPESWLHR